MSSDSDSDGSLWGTLQGPREPLPRYAVTCKLRVACTVIVAAPNEKSARESAEYDVSSRLYRMSGNFVPANDGRTEYDVVQVADDHDCVHE